MVLVCVVVCAQGREGRWACLAAVPPCSWALDKTGGGPPLETWTNSRRGGCWCLGQTHRSIPGCDSAHLLHLHLSLRLHLHLCRLLIYFPLLLFHLLSYICICNLILFFHMHPQPFLSVYLVSLTSTCLPAFIPPLLYLPSLPFPFTASPQSESFWVTSFSCFSSLLLHLYLYLKPLSSPASSS